MKRTPAADNQKQKEIKTREIKGEKLSDDFHTSTKQQVVRQTAPVDWIQFCGTRATLMVAAIYGHGGDGRGEACPAKWRGSDAPLSECKLEKKETVV